MGALLRGRPELFGDLLERADEHRIKVEVALVVDAPGGRTLARGGFERGPEYFYPASSVKTCAVIAASQLLAEIDAATDFDVGLDTPLRFEPLFPGEAVEERIGEAAGRWAHEDRQVVARVDHSARGAVLEDPRAAPREPPGLEVHGIVGEPPDPARGRRVHRAEDRRRGSRPPRDPP